METLVWMFVVGAIAAAGVVVGVKRRSIRLQGLFILSSFPPLVIPAKAGIHITAAYGNFPVARLYRFPPARE